MRNKRMLLMVGLLLLLGVGLASAQQTPPNLGSYWRGHPANEMFDGNVYIQGTLYRGTAQTDWFQTFPATTACQSDATSGTLVSTRIAAADWALGRTAAAVETYNITCAISIPSRTATSAGAKLTNLTIVYRNASTYNLIGATIGGVKLVTYTVGTQNTLTNYGTITVSTLPIATTSSTSKVSIDITGGTFLNTIGQIVVLDFGVTIPKYGTYYFYGVQATFPRAD